MKKDLSYESGGWEGIECKIHPVRYIQEKWNKFVVFGKHSYFEFKEWQRGFERTNRYDMPPPDYLIGRSDDNGTW